MHKAIKTAKQTGRQIQITMQCRGYKDIVDAVYEAVNGLVSYLSSMVLLRAVVIVDSINRPQII